MPRTVVVGDHRYEGVDAERTIASLPQLWAHHTHATSAALDAVADVLIERLSTETGVDAPSSGDSESRLVTLATTLGERLDEFDDERLARVLSTLWDTLARARDTSVTHIGRIERLFAGRGLPKPEVESFDVDWSGPAGDVRRSRVHHGRPHQAVCIWSTEVIGELVAEGNPIGPGYAGENLTLSGIPWAAMRPGSLVEIGKARLRLTAYTTPCNSNAEWFAGREFDRMSHLRGDVSRLYAMVLAPGSVTVGDPVVVRTDR